MPTVALLLLLLPLFFLNVHEGHSWGGDDFAQYIKEAENISKGKPYYQSGFVFYPQNVCYSPPQYPPGFPLLLAPVIKASGLSIKAMCYFNTLLVVILALVVFAWLKKEAGALPSFCITLLIAYSWVIVDIKQSVLSDLPCLLFTMLYLLARRAEKFTAMRIIYLIIIATMTLLIRTQSIMLVAAEIIVVFINLVKGILKEKRFDKKYLYPGLYIASGALVFHFIIGKTIFYTPATASGFYVNYLIYVSKTGIPTIVRNNINFLLQTINSFFYYETDSGVRTAMVTLMQSGGLILSITGFFISICKRLSVEDIFFVLMALMMLYYPIHDTRYFLPVIVIVYYYCYVALKKILPAITNIPARRIGIGITVICLFAGLKYLKSTLQPPPGYRPAANDYQAFHYIEQHIDDSDIIIFSRPRLLTLYTHKRCMVFSWLIPMEENRKIFDSMKVKYVLNLKGVADAYMTQYFATTQKPKDSLEIAEGYTLYRLR